MQVLQQQIIIVKMWKKGKVIAEISQDIQKTSRNIAFQIYGYVNNKEDLNFLYQTFPLIFK